MHYVAPTVTNSFNCPYPECGALAHQTWFMVHADSYSDGNFPWYHVGEDIEEKIDRDHGVATENKASLKDHFRKISSGGLFISAAHRESTYAPRLYNLDVSQCFSCKRFSVWNYGKLILPKMIVNIHPNQDLCDDIKRDFAEAAEILPLSPRGSAALLRLCIQKLCRELGEKGKNINDDIASLVKKGLDVRIRQALDVVRVIGNEAVHPGQMDLRDDSETATRLFGIVNMIADAMISQPKSIDELFNSLPESKRNEITRRDT